MDSLKQLAEFLKPNQRLDLKAIATKYVLSLTASESGRAAILSLDDVMAGIFQLTNDSSQEVTKTVVFILINLSAQESGAVKIYELATKLQPVFPLVEQAVQHILNENAEHADIWSMVLNNLTRVDSLVENVFLTLSRNKKTLLKLARAFGKLDYNKKKRNLHYLAAIFCNLTQTTQGRKIFCNAKYRLLDELLPFTTYKESLIRRAGTIGTLKNICFDPIYHERILNDNYEMLPAILYPLCGPNEYTEEENEKFPLQLQYLPDTKTHEEDPDLRKMLLDCLLQLCATRRIRELLRAKGTYEILREYHKWEANVGRDKKCLLACENVVGILIKKEEEIGLDNYKEVDVPPEAAEKFIKEDAEYLQNLLD